MYSRSRCARVIWKPHQQGTNLALRQMGRQAQIPSACISLGQKERTHHAYNTGISMQERTYVVSAVITHPDPG